MGAFVEKLTDPNSDDSKNPSPKLDYDSALLFGVSTWSIAVDLWVRDGHKKPIPVVFREHPFTYQLFAFLAGLAFFSSIGALWSYAWPRPSPRLGLILKRCSCTFMSAVVVLVSVLFFRCVFRGSSCR